MKYIETCTNFLFVLWVWSILFFLLRKTTSGNLSSVSLSFWPSWRVLTAMYCFQSSHLDSRWLIWVTQRSIRRSHWSGLAPRWLLMLMDWEISQTRFCTLLSFRCVDNLPFSCQIRMVSAAHWLTVMLAFSAQMLTCRVGNWSVLASATSDFRNL